MSTPYNIEVRHVCAGCGESLEVVTDQRMLVRNGETYQTVILMVTPCACVQGAAPCTHKDECPLYEEE